MHNCIKIIENGPNEIEVSHEDGGLGQATIDENGRVDLGLGTKWTLPDGTVVKSQLRGFQIFDIVMKHFGTRVKSIGGHWAYGDNLAKFNELTAEGFTKEDAAAGTWTGLQAARYGFTQPTRIVTQGSKGAYTMVDVVFIHG